MYRSQYFEGGRVLTAAISAIDIALYDIKGKALGVPVYQLLGGKQRDIVPCFATAAAPMGPQLVENVQDFIRARLERDPHRPGHAGQPAPDGPTCSSRASRSASPPSG